MADDRFQQLKEKYVSVLHAVNAEDIQVHNMHVQNDKLFIKGTAPSNDAKNRFWQAVKKADPGYEKDFQAEIDVKPAAKPAAAPTAPAQAKPAPATAAAPAESAEQTYTVQKGDTLSAISKKFYGKANEYMKIFNANKDQLKDPDRINVGQVLKIPKA